MAVRENTREGCKIWDTKEETCNKVKLQAHVLNFDRTRTNTPLLPVISYTVHLFDPFCLFCHEVLFCLWIQRSHGAAEPIKTSRADFAESFCAS